MRSTTVPKRQLPANGFGQADRREVQNERVSKLENGRRVSAQLQESRDMLLDGTSEQKVLSHRDAERQAHSDSKSRTSQTDTW